MDMEDNNSAKKRKEGATVSQPTANIPVPVVNINLGNFIPQLFTSLGNPPAHRKAPQQLARSNDTQAANAPHQYLSIKKFIHNLQEEENKAYMMRSPGPSVKRRDYINFGNLLIKAGFGTVKDLVILAIEEAKSISVTPYIHLKNFLLEETDAAELPDRFTMSTVISEARRIVDQIDNTH